MTSPTEPAQPKAPSLRRFWTVFFVSGFASALLLHWRGLPLVLVPETAAALALVACAAVEWALPSR